MRKKIWTKIKEVIRLLFTPYHQCNSVEDAMFGFDMFQMDEEDNI